MKPLSRSLSRQGGRALALLDSALPPANKLVESIAADLARMSGAEAAGVLRRVRRTLFELATIREPDASELAIEGILIAFLDRVVKKRESIRADMRLT